MRFILSIVLAILATPAVAGASPWQEIAPGTRIRLITTDELMPDGKTLVGIEIDMPQNTKTYWRVPGETGIATKLDTAGSVGVEAYAIIWPVPLAENKGGYLDYVYYGPTVLPIELAVEGDAPVLQLALTMGVCSDICVPAMAEFSLPLSFEKPDAAQKIRLKQALARTPAPWTAEVSPFGEVGFDAEADALAVAVDDPEVDPGSLIADMGAGGPLFGAPQKSPEPGVFLLPLLGGSDIEGWEGQPVQLTFSTPAGPFETLRTLDAAVSTTSAP